MKITISIFVVLDVEDCNMIIQKDFSICKHELYQILSRNRDKKLDENKIERKYVDRALIHGSPRILFYISDNRVVGSITDFPTTIGGCSGKVMHHVGDIAVDLAHRQKGVGTKLVRFLTDNSDRDDLYLCMPTKPARKMLLKSGWRKMVRLRQYSLALGIPCGGSSGKLLCLLNQKILQIFCFLVLRMHPIPKKYHIERKYKFDHEFELLWNDLLKTDKIYLCRNRESLELRYPDLSDVSIEIYMLKLGHSIEGFIVIKRVEPDKLSIHDAVYKDYDAFRALILSIFKLVRNQLVCKVDIRINENLDNEISFLKKVAFFPRDDIWNIVGFCHPSSLSCTDMEKKNRWMLTEADKDI